MGDDKAIRAAMKALRGRAIRDVGPGVVGLAVEAARPVIEAETLREAADYLSKFDGEPSVLSVAAAWLSDEADRTEREADRW